MPSPVTRVCLTPHKPFAAVVSLRSGPPLVVDLAQEQHTTTPLDGVNLKGMYCMRSHSCVHPWWLLMHGGDRCKGSALDVD
jgi:hypothetical protein